MGFSVSLKLINYLNSINQLFKLKDNIIVKIPKFRAADFFMIRTPMKSLDFYNDIDAHIKDSDLEKYKLYMFELYNHRQIKEIIESISPSLGNSLSNLQNQKDIKKVNQTLNSFLKYLIRMSTRCTPFGLLSAVGFGKISDKVQDNIANSDFIEDMKIAMKLSESKHIDKKNQVYLCPSRYKTERYSEIRKFIRPDMSWIMNIVSKLENDLDLVSKLKVKVNGALMRRGNRIELPYVTKYCVQDSKSSNKLDCLSIRMTRVVNMILATAKFHIYFEKLGEIIKEQYQNVELKRIHKLIHHLVKSEILITELRPPLMDCSPLEYIISKLKGLNSRESDKQISSLLEIQSLITKYENCKIGDGIDILRELTTKSNSLHNVSSPLQIDSYNTRNNILFPENLKDELSQLTQFLWKLNTTSQFHWLDNYRNKFIDKYGTTREISLLELLDRDLGIGAPDRYPYESNNKSVETISNSLDSRLRDFIIRQTLKCIRTGTHEIIIDDGIIDSFSKDKQTKELDNKDILFPESIELIFSVIANSIDDVEKDKYELILGNSIGSNKAGSFFGRFYGMIPNNIHKELQDICSKNHSTDVIDAEITYMPPFGRTANVSISTNYSKYEIAISTNSSKTCENTIELSDILIGISNNKFYAKSKRLNKLLNISANNMLNFSYSPNAYRFLREICIDQKLIFSPDIGNVIDVLPYVPTLKYKKTILLPAQFKINFDVLNLNEKCCFEEFKLSFIQWSEYYELKFIHITNGDNYLLINIQNSYHLQILFSEMKKLQFQYLILSDANYLSSQLWFRENNECYLSEIVIPMINTETNVNANLAKITNNHYTKISDQDRLKYPGSEWIYIKIYGNEYRQDEFIAYYLRPLVTKIFKDGLVSKFHFIRYFDRDFHFRVRFKVVNITKIAEFMSILNEWFSELKINGIMSKVSIDTYEREIERYGGIKFIDIAEDIFFQDSMTVIEDIFSILNIDTSHDRVCIAVNNILCYLNSFVDNIDDQINFFGNPFKYNKYSNEFRERTVELMSKVENNFQYPSINTSINTSIRLFRERYRETQLYKNTELTNNIDNILDSFIHMHCNRMFGINHDEEFKVRALTLKLLKKIKGITKNTNKKDLY